jgi:hypothetical protein
VPDCSLGSVDVHPRPVAQTACCRIVFFTIQVMARPIQHILRTP